MRLPRWITARLGNDMNWWVVEASDEIYWPREGLSILDPRQLRDVLERLEEYRTIGFHPEAFARAFNLFVMQSDLGEGRLRLMPAQGAAQEDLKNVFAMPAIHSEEQSQYGDFIDTLEGWRVTLLNRTHEYTRSVDVMDLEEELQERANDRYFGGENVHCYDEINDILAWQPAEWDEKEQPERPQDTGADSGEELDWR